MIALYTLYALSLIFSYEWLIYNPMFLNVSFHNVVYSLSFEVLLPFVAITIVLSISKLLIEFVFSTSLCPKENVSGYQK